MTSTKKPLMSWYRSATIEEAWKTKGRKVYWGYRLASETRWHWKLTAYKEIPVAEIGEYSG